MSDFQLQKHPNISDTFNFTEDWQISQQQSNQLQELYQLILEGNKYQNLTRIVEATDFWEKHLWDSLVAIKNWEENLTLDLHLPAKVIDLGTGAGFPGIPLAICYPDWHFTLVDSTRKKINFIQSILPKLNLDNLNAVVARIEEIGRKKEYRESYDLALIRAVSEPSVCAEYSLPLLKIGGIAILYRGNWSEVEALSLRTAIELLGGEIKSVRKITTPISHSTRHCLYLQKIRRTPPEFPRRVGIPSQKPL
jgi:16S rRNA (guanine527-N7)-methyltransferase